MKLLITDWRKAWKLWSIQFNALGLLVLSCADIINQAWATLAPSLSHHIPHARTIAVTLFVIAILARLIPQGTKND